MNIFVKLLLTGVGIFLIISGGADFGLTSIPGIILIGAVWGIPLLKVL